MSRWRDASTWTGDGLRREVFFFHSGGRELYGSLYASTAPSRPFGVVACGSWGVEADRTDPLVRSVALSMARLGGAGLVFHYPGYGDSYGDLAEVGLADLNEAAVDAVEEASRRRPGVAWILAGFMLGAAVACLAQRRAGVERLLLVQPALRPGAYFGRLAGGAPLAIGNGASGETMTVDAAMGMAYGYPIPARIADRAAEADAAVDAALAAFAGEGAVVGQASHDGQDSTPAGFERVEAPGRWRFGSREHPGLGAAAVEWLDRRTRGEGR
jgi:alpha/beta superfamily hydrolase